MTPDAIGPDLKTTLKRLRLGRTLDTLPERLLLARQQKMPHADFLLLVLADEVSRVARRDDLRTSAPGGIDSRGCARLSAQPQPGSQSGKW